VQDGEEEQVGILMHGIEDAIDIFSLFLFFLSPDAN